MLKVAGLLAFLQSLSLSGLSEKAQENALLILSSLSREKGTVDAVGDVSGGRPLMYQPIYILIRCWLLETAG